jgi:hypothetical protein
VPVGNPDGAVECGRHGGQGVTGASSLELEGSSEGVVPADVGVGGVVSGVDGVVVAIGCSGGESGGAVGFGAVALVVADAAVLDGVGAGAHAPVAPSIDTVTVEVRPSPADADPA